MITKKQVNYLVWLIEGNLPDLFSKIPKNNNRYPNVKADYRRHILADQLDKLNHRDAQTLIALVQDKKEEAVAQFIWGLTLPNF